MTLTIVTLTTVNKESEGEHCSQLIGSRTGEEWLKPGKPGSTLDLEGEGFDVKQAF